MIFCEETLSCPVHGILGLLIIQQPLLRPNFLLFPFLNRLLLCVYTSIKFIQYPTPLRKPLHLLYLHRHLRLLPLIIAHLLEHLRINLIHPQFPISDYQTYYQCHYSPSNKTPSHYNKYECSFPHAEPGLSALCDTAGGVSEGEVLELGLGSGHGRGIHQLINKGVGAVSVIPVWGYHHENPLVRFEEILPTSCCDISERSRRLK